ncbi:VOC family protein [Hufsiella ginkgonis]|uniref:VOC family protein n=1 Tax=Hufsiella ginkgonis TaxID=2695274 RepID=A0A7K1XZT1_9SPHI|nr:VOC family protein [Hufsiella ginkgonis]MXV16521.1 VOC family protein [Hufsiella ginkgonis]
METYKILGLRTTIYQVSDIGEAKAWYAGVFNTKPYFDEPFYVGFNIAGYELGLQPEEQPVTRKAESVAAYWGVEEVQVAYDAFIAAGATEHEKPTDVGEGIIAATVKDPWGNVVGLIHNPYFTLG